MTAPAYRWQFAAGLLCLLLAQPLQLLNPLFWKFVVDDVLLGDSPAFLDVFQGTPYHVMVRFGPWNEILEEPEPAGELHAARAVWRYARGIALASLELPHGEAGEEVEVEIYYQRELRWSRVMAPARVVEKVFWDPPRRRKTPPNDF